MYLKLTNLSRNLVFRTFPYLQTKILEHILPVKLNNMRENQLKNITLT